MGEQDNAAISFLDMCVLPDEQIGIHTQPSWELSYVHEGTGWRQIGDRVEAIEQGGVVLVPPNVPHLWKFDAVQKNAHNSICTISVMFPPEVLGNLMSLFPEIKECIAGILSLEGAISYTEPLRTRIADILLSMRNLRPAARLPFMFELLLQLSDTSHSRRAGDSCHLTALERKLGRLNTFCICNFNKSVSLEAAARHMGMNKSSFCAFVKRNTGLTFSEYLNGIKLCRAEELLADGEKRISEVAYESGFTSVPYFNRVFRRKHGCSPKEYRVGCR